METRRNLPRLMMVVVVAFSVSAVPTATAGSLLDALMDQGDRGTSFPWGGWWHDIRRPAASSMVRILHASPDAPAVDVWVDGTKAFADVSFGEATAYLSVESGMRNVVVVPANATEPVVLNVTVEIEPRTAYTVLAAGRLENLTLVPLVDTTRTSSRMAHFRLIHASPDAPDVDLAPDGRAPAFAGVTYGESTGYMPVPRGIYDLEVRVAGTDTVALDLAPVALNRQSAYTAYAIGLVEDGSLQVVLTRDMGRMR